jgi:UDP-N-acetyl-D-galactosamine dehydrogenase
MIQLSQAKIAIIGLGYVGLPLAVAFGKKFPSIGFDIRAARVNALRMGVDSTLEVSAEELATLTAAPGVHTPGLYFSSDQADLAACNVFIVTVPTPIDAAKRPDLTPLISASAVFYTHLRAHETM